MSSGACVRQAMSVCRTSGVCGCMWVGMRVSVCVSGCMSSDCRHAHAIAPVSHALDVADVRIEHQNASLTRGNTVPHIIAKLDDVCTTSKHVLVTVIYS